MSVFGASTQDYLCMQSYAVNRISMTDTKKIYVNQSSNFLSLVTKLVSKPYRVGSHKLRYIRGILSRTLQVTSSS